MAPTETGDTPVETPWHDRPSVLVAAAVVGAGGLIALAVSVLTVSDQSVHPADHPPAAASSEVSVTSAPALPITSAAASDPPLAPPPPDVAAVPDFEAGPTAELMTPPPPPPPAPVGIPPWLLRLFPNLNPAPG